MSEIVIIVVAVIVIALIIALFLKPKGYVTSDKAVEPFSVKIKRIDNDSIGVEVKDFNGIPVKGILVVERRTSSTATTGKNGTATVKGMQPGLGFSRILIRYNKNKENKEVTGAVYGGFA